MNKFEVGKFYALNVNQFSRKKIPAKCIRVTKCTVTFQYIYMSLENTLRMGTVRRRKRCDNGEEVAYDPDLWSGYMITYSSELREKPSQWGDIEVEGGVK